MKKSIISYTILWFLFTGFILLAQESSAQCNDIYEYQTLRELYLNTDGDNWEDNTGWPTAAEFSANPTLPVGTDMSTWYGIQCTPKIWRINLRRNNLVGSLPDSFIDFTNLQTFDLNGNEINGNLPTLFNPNSIRYINLSANKITGGIPSGYENLLKLRVLNLGFNNINGTLSSDLSNLTKLEDFDLTNNNISGLIPSTYNNLDSLKSFKIGGNNITDTFPSFLTLLPNLSRIDISRNSISGVIPSDIVNLSKLITLDLSSNHISGGIPLQLSSLSFLRVLDLSSNQISGSIPIFVIDSLRSLDLSSNDITGSIPSSILQNNLLTSLKLGYNQLTDQIPDNIGDLTNLTRLSLKINQLTGEIPTSLGDLNNLVYLELNGNLLSGIIPSSLGDLNKLERIWLSYNNFSGCFDSNLFNLCSVTTKDFSNNPLLPWLGDFDQFCATSGSQSDQVGAPCDDGNASNGTNDNILTDCSCGESSCVHPDYDALVALYNNTDGDNWTKNGTGADPTSTSEGWAKDCDVCNWYGISCDANGRVIKMNLNKNNLSGKLPIEIGELEFIKELYLKENILIDTLPFALGNLKKLEELFLTKNDFTGIIPDTLSTLLSLKYFSLSANEFTGIIPPSLGDLVNLERLYLSYNFLTGEIPSSLGNLTKLERLYIRYDQLSGEIPSSFLNLVNLERLILSGNQLTGQIPGFNLPNLVSLRLNENNFSCFVPQQIIDQFCSIGFNTTDPGYNLMDNPLLPFEGDMERICNGENQIGASCDDGDNTNGTNDIINNDCSCGEVLCAHPDYNALMAFYNSTDGDNWIENGTIADPTSTTEGWGKDCDPCNWLGIVCNGLDRVIKIQFVGNNNILGPIPSEIQELIYLEEFDIERNKLNGNLPPELGSLSNLRRINFFMNNLTGVLPIELSNLTNLETLWLAFNDFSGSIPIEFKNLTSLRYFSIGSNQISGNIPPELGQLSSLRTFAVQSNNLTGNIPPELGQLSSLSIFSASSNNLNGNIPSELGNLSNLTELFLYNNKLDGQIPINLGNLSNLKELVLYNNLLEGGIPSELGNLANLEILKLNNNNLSCFIPQEVFDAHCHLGFTTLFDTLGYNLMNNPLLPYEGDMERICNGEPQIGASCDDGNAANGTNDIINSDCTCGEVLCTHPDYVALMAFYNSTDGDNWTRNGTGANPVSTTEGWGKDCDVCQWIGIDCGSTSRVINLRFMNNNIKGYLPVEIGNLDSLGILEIIHDNLMDTIPSSIGNLSILTKLNFINNDITGVIPIEIGQLLQLRSIWLGRNKLSGTLPIEISNLSELRVLFLFSNQISGEIPIEYATLSNLQSLFLSNNSLTGPIHKELGNLTNLTKLGLGQNGFTGDIPPELGNLINLKYLNLATNLLTGEIPSTFGNLTNLEQLFMYNNSLSGQIPLELGNLTSIAEIKLNDNNFSCFYPDEVLDLLCPLGFSTVFDTIGYNIMNNPLLPYEGDMERICNGEPQIGANCDDGDPSNGSADIILDDCSCGMSCPTITLSVSSSGEVCDGENDNITFLVDGGEEPYILIWSGDTIRNLMNGDQLLLAPGIHALVSIEDINGCRGDVPLPFEILEATPLPVHVVGNLTFCNGESTYLSAPEGYNYTWVKGSTVIGTNQVQEVIASGEIILIISDGKCMASDTVILEELVEIPVVINGRESYCVGDSTQLSGPIGYSYIWYEGGVVISTDQTIFVQQDGLYSLFVSDGICENSDSVYIQEADPIKEGIVGDDSFCFGESLELSGPIGFEYAWYDNTSIISTDPTVLISETGTYYLIMSDGKCEAVDSIAIKELDPLPIDIVGSPTFCNGYFTTLSAPNSFTYRWFNETIEIGADQIINVDESGRYILEISNGNCENQDTIDVIELPALPVTISGDTSICEGERIVLSAPLDYDYKWSYQTNIISIEQTVDVLSSGKYYLLITDGVCEAIDSVTVFEHPSPLIIAEDLTDITFSEGIELPVDYNGDISSYTWNPSEGLSCSDCPYPFLKSKTDNEYQIEVVNPFGCYASAMINVTFLEEQLQLLIPNIVSLNDPYNNTFYLNSLEDMKYDLAIFDRWGNSLFNQKGIISNQATSGWVPNNDYNSGVFIYKIEYNIDGKTIIKTGDITIVR